MLKPLKNRVLIERDAPKTVFDSEGLFAVPNGYEVKETTGTVIAIGSNVKDISVGDRVLFGVHDGVSVPNSVMEHKGDYLLIQDNAVRAIFSNVVD
jgi:co-chaperonin GroES (HSP10)